MFFRFPKMFYATLMVPNDLMEPIVEMPLEFY